MSVAEFFALNSMFADDADKDKYNDLAKSVCKLEHGFMLGHDIVKEAAKQTTVESFDQVIYHQHTKKIDQLTKFFFSSILTFHCAGVGRPTK